MQYYYTQPKRSLQSLPPLPIENGHVANQNNYKWIENAGSGYIKPGFIGADLLTATWAYFASPPRVQVHGDSSEYLKPSAFYYLQENACPLSAIGRFSSKTMGKPLPLASEYLKRAVWLSKKDRDLIPNKELFSSTFAAFSYEHRL